MSEDLKGNASGENGEVTNPSETGEQPAKVVETGESTTPKEPGAETTVKKGAEPTAAEKRIRQLVAERHERDREIERLKGQLDAKGKPEASKPAELPAGQLPPRPQASNYTDYDEYLTDLSVWKGEVKKIQEEQTKTQQQYQRNLKDMEEGFQKRISEDSVDNPEVTTMRDRVGTKISPAVAFAVKQSDAAPDLIRYLDANPSEIERLAKLDLVAAAREIGKIESKLANPGKPKVASGAPEPHKPAGSGTGTVTTQKSEDELPMDDYMKAFRKRGRS